jgi:hypothetical protein
MSVECGDVYVLTDNPDLPEPVNCKREPEHKGWHRHSFQTSATGSTVWIIEWNDSGEHRYGKEG